MTKDRKQPTKVKKHVRETVTYLTLGTTGAVRNPRHEATQTY